MTTTNPNRKAYLAKYVVEQGRRWLTNFFIDSRSMFKDRCREHEKKEKGTDKAWPPTARAIDNPLETLPR